MTMSNPAQRANRAAMTQRAPILAQARPATTGLTGKIRVPGDKSISHRALMFAALAVGTSRITGLLEGEDVLRTAAAMRALGASVTNHGACVWSVTGLGLGALQTPDDVVLFDRHARG